MTDRDRKRRGTPFSEPASYEDKPMPEPKRGVIGQMLQPRFPDASIPRAGISLVRGMLAAASSVWVVVMVAALTFSVWLGMLAAGFQGPFAWMASLFALPPVGSAFDVSVGFRFFGVTQGGMLFALAVVVGRSILFALLTALVVDSLRGVRSSGLSLVRGLMILPMTLAVNLLSMAIFIVAPQVAGVIGGGPGLFLEMGAFAIFLYLLAFAPFIALAERRSVADSVSRSVHNARVPGAGNLTFAIMYVIAALVVALGSQQVTAKLGVNPSIVGWLTVILINFIHVGCYAAFGYRYFWVSEVAPTFELNPQAVAAQARANQGKSRRGRR